jgi:hypothetical protein
MAPPVAARLADGRLHLQHGPIDVVLRAWGPRDQVEAAERAAVARFGTVLAELAAELPALRRDLRDAPALHGVVARRMLAGCAPFAATGVFVTAMAAVAGAVADELLAAMRAAAPGLARAFVNDGGDIAVFVAPGQTLAVGLLGGDIPDVSRASGGRSDARAARAGGGRATFDGTLILTATDAIGGIATSGRHGRSFSLGIADAVTVLARDAATADAAATLVANAVNLDSAAVTRRPARELDPDSDLGDRPVTVDVGALAATEIARALDAGAEQAQAWTAAGLIRAAALRLRGDARFVGTPFPALAEATP